METLHRDGKTCAEITTLMNKAVSGRTLISDNPEYDGAWLKEVFEVAEIDPAFEVSDISADALIAAAAGKFGILDLEYTWVEQETARLAPQTHRAAADAKYWGRSSGFCNSGRRNWRGAGWLPAAESR